MRRSREIREDHKFGDHGPGPPAVPKLWVNDVCNRPDHVFNRSDQNGTLRTDSEVFDPTVEQTTVDESDGTVAGHDQVSKGTELSGAAEFGPFHLFGEVERSGRPVGFPRKNLRVS
jgi:hypothetical protein